ncbi:MAG: hypothetical protein ACHREM_06645 [Polyangiales bacterium]
MARTRMTGTTSAPKWSDATLRRAIKYGAAVARKKGLEDGEGEAGIIVAMVAPEIDAADEQTWKNAITRKVEDRARAGRRRAARRSEAEAAAATDDEGVLEFAGTREKEPTRTKTWVAGDSGILNPLGQVAPEDAADLEPTLVSEDILFAAEALARLATWVRESAGFRLVGPYVGQVLRAYVGAFRCHPRDAADVRLARTIRGVLKDFHAQKSCDDPMSVDECVTAIAAESGCVGAVTAADVERMIAASSITSGGRGRPGAAPGRVAADFVNARRAVAGRSKLGMPQLGPNFLKAQVLPPRARKLRAPRK